VNAAADSSSSVKITAHQQYHTEGIDADDLSPSPLALFQRWFTHAQQQGVSQPEAMLLSTVDTSVNPPRPSSRVVLLKSILPDKGLTFFSNYDSRKGREIAADPWVSCVFFWDGLHRSVRFLGKATRVPKEESQEYFDSRPVGSRIGAWASPQSSVIAGGREELEQKVRQTEQKFGVPGAAGLTESDKWEGSEDPKIPVPEYWGGYRIDPYEVEFWSGRPNRLHDRFRYTRSADSNKSPAEDQWKIDRLAP
ncbi:pyridoxamine 5'-phosphate oxidase, partial [Jaminaea rosea]